MAMDEASITQTPQSTPATPDSDIKGGIETTYREFSPLYKHFDVEQSDKADKALEMIWEYAKKNSPSQDKDSLILQVIKLNHELGDAGLGQAPYAKMKLYLEVYKQFKSAGKLLEDLKK